MEEDFLPEIAQMPWLVVNSVLLLGGKNVPLGLLSCLLVPRPGSAPTKEG